MPSRIDERRRHVRQSTISGQLPGKLVDCQTSKELDAWPLDVSPRGLGLLVKVVLKPGTRLWLSLERKEITLEVVSCQPHLGIDNLFRCGLFVRDANEDLLVLFEALGLISGSENGFKTAPKKE